MKKYLFLAGCSIFFMLSACTTHYKLTDVSRTRILVDRTYESPVDAKAMAFLAPYKEKVDSFMSPVVGNCAHDMSVSRPESTLSNLLPDVFIFMSKNYGERPQFAVYNMGGIRAGLSKGPVTFGDVLDVAPFDNKITFLTLTGEKVTELFQQIAKRGGEGVSEGVKLVISKDGNLISATLYGKEIDPKAEYRVATIDYLAEGNDGLTAFKSGTNIKSPADEKDNARNVIANFFREKRAKGQTVSSKVEGRITIQ